MCVYMSPVGAQHTYLWHMGEDVGSNLCPRRISLHTEQFHVRGRSTDEPGETHPTSGARLGDAPPGAAGQHLQQSALLGAAGVAEAIALGSVEGALDKRGQRPAVHAVGSSAVHRHDGKYGFYGRPGHIKHSPMNASWVELLGQPQSFLGMGQRGGLVLGGGGNGVAASLFPPVAPSRPMRPDTVGAPLIMRRGTLNPSRLDNSR